MTTRRARLRTSALLAIVLGTAAPAGAVSGALDPTFGDGGGTTITLPGTATAGEIAILRDGRIVVGGTLLQGTSVDSFAIARLESDGSLDPTFGDHGTSIATDPTAIGGAKLAHLVALPDGGLLVGGVDFPTGFESSILARFKPDGAIDQSFGTAGFFPVGAGRFSGLFADSFVTVTLSSSRLANGVERTLRFLVPGVGTTTNAEVRAPDLSAGALAAQDDGRLVFVETGPQMIVTRLLGTQKDPGFGSAGEVVVPPDIALAGATAIVVLPDNRFVIAGLAGSGGDLRPAVVRLLPDGAPDPSFGDGGRVMLPGANVRAESMVHLADGRVIVGGRSCPIHCEGLLFALREDGRLDPAFGTGGIVRELSAVAALALSDAEHLVAVGDKHGRLVVVRHLLGTCGNGVLEAGETCDDGNTEGGDCCAADCITDADGAACAADASVCTADVCRAGSCTHEPPSEAGCAIAESSSLLLVDAADDAADRVRFLWSSGTTPAGILGDPTTTTDVSLCVIDGPPDARRLVAELTAPAAASCGSASCWRATSAGFRYRDRRRTHDGIGTLAVSVDGADARVVLKARGPALEPTAPAAGSRLLVRVVQSDAPGCFEATVVPDATGGTRVRAVTP